MIKKLLEEISYFAFKCEHYVQVNIIEVLRDAIKGKKE